MPRGENKSRTRPAEKMQSLATLRKMLWMDNIPSHLLYREKELSSISEFCRNFINQKNNVSSLYLGGVPGTGKTSCVLQTIEALKKDSKLRFKFIHLNGGEMIKPEDLYVEFYQKLVGSTTRVSVSCARQQLTTIFAYADSKRLPTIVLIDELDFLVNKSQSVIYDVLDFASLPEARLAIISITNTFDFTSRVLDHRIQSRIGTNRLHFQPYEWTQIEGILKNRLSNCDHLFDKSAIQLASRKVANMSGDIRKALDILRRAIDIAVANDKKKLSMKEIDEALKESKNTYRMCLVRSMSLHELRFFRALYKELLHSSLQETSFAHVFRYYEQLCLDEDIEALNIDQIMEFVLDNVGTGLYKVSKAPGSLSRKISLGFAMYEAKFCLDAMEAEKN